MVARNKDPQDHELRRFEPLIGEQVASADARAQVYALSISFTNGYKFVLLTSKPRRIKPPAIPLWELSTPYGKAIFVQRNGYVDIVPEDVSLETLLAEGHLRG